MSTFNLPALGR